MFVVKQRSGTKVPFAAPAPRSVLDHLSPGECGMGAVWPGDGVGWEDLPALPLASLHLTLNGKVLCSWQPQRCRHGIALGQRGDMSLAMRGDLHSVCL